MNDAGPDADVAIESAHLTLIQGDLRGIVRARNLSEAMMRNIKRNLFFAFLYNILGVPLAAGVSIPFFGLLLSLIITRQRSADVQLGDCDCGTLRLRAARL
jgi:Cu+-exporting ATPase